MYSNLREQKKLYMCYLICELFLRSGASTTEISEVTQISKSSIKRYLKELKYNKEKFLYYFPDIFNENELDQFNSKISKELLNNKINNKWSNCNVSFNNYDVLIDSIVNIFEEIKPKTPDKDVINNLRFDGNTITNIQAFTGYSRGSVHKVIKENEGKKLK